MSLVYLDCETTGLDPDRHMIWELALIGERTHVWHFYPEMDKAEPMALQVGNFYQRSLYDADWDAPWGAAAEIARIVDGQHLVGVNPAFDAAFLSRFLRRHGQVATWNYHLVDVLALIAGHYQIEPPWDSKRLSERIGVDHTYFDRHTALGDAQWAKALYEAVMTR